MSVCQPRSMTVTDSPLVRSDGGRSIRAGDEAQPPRTPIAAPTATARALTFKDQRQGGPLPSEQMTVVLRLLGGTTTVVFDAGGVGELLLTHPAMLNRSGPNTSDAMAIRLIFP